MDSNNYYNNQDNGAASYQYDYVAPTQEMYQANAGKKSTALSVVALVCGIVGILSCCCCGVGFIFGIMAIVLAIIVKVQDGKMSGVAIAALVCGILSIIATIGGGFLWFYTGALDSFIEGFYEGYYGY